MPRCRYVWLMITTNTVQFPTCSDKTLPYSPTQVIYTQGDRHSSHFYSAHPINLIDTCSSYLLVLVLSHKQVIGNNTVYTPVYILHNCRRPSPIRCSGTDAYEAVDQNSSPCSQLCCKSQLSAALSWSWVCLYPKVLTSVVKLSILWLQIVKMYFEPTSQSDDHWMCV